MEGSGHSAMSRNSKLAIEGDRSWISLTLSCPLMVISLYRNELTGHRHFKSKAELTDACEWDLGIQLIDCNSTDCSLE